MLVTNCNRLSGQKGGEGVPAHAARRCAQHVLRRVRPGAEKTMQRQIRTHWDEEQEKWYFSIVDVVDGFGNQKSVCSFGWNSDAGEWLPSRVSRVRLLSGEN